MAGETVGSSRDSSILRQKKIQLSVVSYFVVVLRLSACSHFLGELLSWVMGGTSCSFWSVAYGCSEIPQASSGLLIPGIHGVGPDLQDVVREAGEISAELGTHKWKGNELWLLSSGFLPPALIISLLGYCLPFVFANEASSAEEK